MDDNLRMEGWSQACLGKHPVPADLQCLLKMQWHRVGKGGEHGDLLWELCISLVDNGDEVRELTDDSYLTDEDKADPDIMANVLAIREVFKYIHFIARDDNSNILGYWCGPQGVPLEDAPIVSYDTEGQFRVMDGGNFAEALLGRYHYILANDDDEIDDSFIQLRDLFRECGIHIEANTRDELYAPNPTLSPDVMAHKIYNEHRVKAGLAPIH